MKKKRHTLMKNEYDKQLIARKGKWSRRTFLEKYHAFDYCLGTRKLTLAEKWGSSRSYAYLDILEGKRLGLINCGSVIFDFKNRSNPYRK